MIPEALVVASRNPDKVAEFSRLLAPGGWEVVALDDARGGREATWEEDSPTYVGNAIIKAAAAAAATGLPALGDDSGVEVLALGGWPGLRTARWLGGDASASQLREAMQVEVAKLPQDRRQAAFVCALALVLPQAGGQPRTITVEARLEGSLLAAPRGGGGFGYDPIFVPRGETRTMAEMPPGEKDRRSHRGLAVAQLLRALAVA
ncbi:MAG: non-canonical purine NTP pyrophosphatase [Candidatus Dormiibacterota bacterium]